MVEGSSSVFISYSWDSKKHRNRVRKLVDLLKNEGINVIYDGDIELRDRLAEFMVNGLSQNDFVLFICTPKYKIKADSNNGGVGFENTIISSELSETQNERKFIPILFSGNWSDSVPNWARGKLGVNLTNTVDFDLEYGKLVSTILNKVAKKNLQLQKIKGIICFFNSNSGDFIIFISI